MNITEKEMENLRIKGFKELQKIKKPQVDFILLNFSDYLEKIDERDNLMEIFWEYQDKHGENYQTPYDKDLTELNTIINSYEENFKLFFRLIKNSKFAYKVSKELFKKQN